MPSTASARAATPVADDPAVQGAIRARSEETVTVIIPSKDRAPLLKQTVLSLLAQAPLPAQLIIVDQSREPMARPRIVAAARGLPSLAVEYVHAPEVSGAAAARNRGMRLARGAIWLFLDDDVILEPGYMAGLLHAYRRQPQAAGISGIIVNYARPVWPLWLWQRVFFLGPFADDRQPVYWHAGEFRDGAPPVRVSRLGAGLMSFRASAIGAVRFDARLTGSSIAEDVDFCFRLPAASPLYITPTARLRHLRAAPGARCHPLEEAAFAAWYLHLGHPHRCRGQGWRFGWLNVGLLVAGSAASLRRRSLDPLRALWAGAATALNLHGRRPRQAQDRVG